MADTVHWVSTPHTAFRETPIGGKVYIDRADMARAAKRAARVVGGSLTYLHSGPLDAAMARRWPPHLEIEIVGKGE